MNKKILESLISNSKSTRDIANEMETSQTNIRYWLKKYKLKTKYNRYNKHSRASNRSCKCGEINEKEFYSTKVKICKKCSNQDTLKRQREKRGKGVAYLGGKCEECKYSKSVSALDFHHINPKEKDKNFSTKRGWSWNRLKKELDKCKLLCKNCHAELHAAKY